MAARARGPGSARSPTAGSRGPRASRRWPPPLTASAPWLSRTLAPLGLGGGGRAGLTRFLVVPDVVRLARGGAGRLVRRAPPCSSPSARRRGDRPPTPSERASRAAGCRCRASTPASVDARGSTPYFGVGDRRHPLLREGARRRPAQRRPACSASTGRSSATTSATSGPFSSLRRAVEHEAFVALAARDLGILTPRMRGHGLRRAERLRARLRGGRRPVARRRPARGDHRRRARPTSGSSSAACATCRIAHRDLRLANLFLGSDGQIWMIDFGFSEIAASDLLLANDVAELVASSSAVVGAERATAHAIAIGRPRHPGRRARPAAAVGAQRRVAHGAEGAARAARRPPGSARPCVNTAGLATAAVGALVLGVSVAAARGPAIPAWEQRLFRAVNGLPGWLFVPLWPVMQLGNLAVGTDRRPRGRLAGRRAAGRRSASLLATGLKLVAERLMRREITSHLPARQRPGTSQPARDPPRRRRARERAELPVGPRRARSPPSPASLAPVLPTGWELVPAALTLGVMVGRVFVGAHNPLDVISGAGAGLMVGGLVACLDPLTHHRRSPSARRGAVVWPRPTVVERCGAERQVGHGPPPRTRGRRARAGLRRPAVDWRRSRRTGCRTPRRRRSPCTG